MNTSAMDAARIAEIEGAPLKFWVFEKSKALF